MTNVKRRKLWRARIADYEASGLTIQEWCKHNELRVGHLRYWLRKSEVTEQTQPWACVELVEDGAADQTTQPNASGKCGETSMGNAGVFLRVGAATIEVRRGFDSTLLSEVLRVVVATC